MSDPIPADIARTARSVADELLDRYLDMGLMTSVPHIERDMAALKIARVIAAERERAAKVCEGNFDSEMRSYGEYFAAAIRGDAT